ncbi:hypothetical protein [Kallotenue papyrolyticum]|uniref:hypothetical protein n=1 Tax=Kallotenue papyrolyticum TaxID=1325125 RepID=UPI0004786381|nr:hypothetical protein [Kallotenue papyrolyticum]
MFTQTFPRQILHMLTLTALGVVLLAVVLPTYAAPLHAPFASPRFEQVWNLTDKAIAEGRATRSWMWGPQPGFSTYEPYQQSPGGQRLVQYFDKARMEINDPANTSGPLGGVTNGLLVVEMVSGRIKQGDGIGPDQNEQRQPAYELPIAGDWAGRLGETPGYVAFRNFATLDNGYRDARKQVGERIGTTFKWAGEIGYREDLAKLPGTDIVAYDEVTGHNIPRVFHDFMQRWPVPAIVAFGHPITDAYWIRANVGGQERDILIQLFERRTITYTPANPDPWKVEMGNVGQHYVYWRYGPDAALGMTR